LSDRHPKYVGEMELNKIRIFSVKIVFITF